MSANELSDEQQARIVKAYVKDGFAGVFAEWWALLAADRTLRSTPEPCSVCNALIVERNPTHYDQLDLDAAKIRARILHSQIAKEPEPDSFHQAGALPTSPAATAEGSEDHRG